MKLIVALGNPGPRYEVTRHNIGWLALDYCKDAWKTSGDVIKNEAEITQFEWKGEKVLLVKPLTFMNLSGKAVAPLYRFYRCEPTDLIVLQDELDLEPYQFKIKKGGGTAGHNGLKSIEASIGTADFARFRLGIGHPRKLNLRMDVADFVLSRFSQQECDEWANVFADVKKGLELALEGNLVQAMNQLNASSKDKKQG